MAIHNRITILEVFLVCPTLPPTIPLGERTGAKALSKSVILIASASLSPYCINLTSKCCFVNKLNILTSLEKHFPLPFHQFVTRSLQ